MHKQRKSKSNAQETKQPQNNMKRSFVALGFLSSKSACSTMVGQVTVSDGDTGQSSSHEFKHHCWKESSCWSINEPKKPLGDQCSTTSASRSVARSLWWTLIAQLSRAVDKRKVAHLSPALIYSRCKWDTSDLIWHTFLSVHWQEVDVIQIQHEQNAKRNGGALGVLSCAEMLLEPLNKTTHHVHGNVLHFTPGSIREDYLLVATQFLLALSSMSKNLTFFLCRVHMLIMVFASHPVDTGQSRQTMPGASTGKPQHDLPVALRYCIVREIQVAALSITCIAIRTAWRIL